MNLAIEKWTSDKGQAEIHYFLEGERNTYVFGFNEKLLGAPLHAFILNLVKSALGGIKKEPMRE